MKSLTTYISESKKTLPYKFDIYNEGEKNKGFKITKRSIRNLYFDLEEDKYDKFINLQLAPKDVTYVDMPTKSSTDNWTKVPELREYTKAGAWYSDKRIEYNFSRYNEDWNAWLTSLKPYMHGKIEAEMYAEDDKLYIRILDKKFQSDLEERKQQLNDVKSLQDWKKKADALDAEMERINKNVKHDHQILTISDYYNRPGINYDGD